MARSLDPMDIVRAQAGETIPPDFRKRAFHCVYCRVLTAQDWEQTNVYGTAQAVWRCVCQNCNGTSWWLTFGPNMGANPPRMIHPRASAAPPPHSDMPEDVAVEYREAASIVGTSPRGAGALLRLALQKLMPHLGESGRDLNADIGSLVRQGLAPTVQQALDSLRVIGNNAVHPLELDLHDDIATVSALFTLLNFIVEDRITRPHELNKVYEQLPEGARQAIERRDRTTDTN
jgi:Domain of unknown function (DUF4145)